MVELGLTPNAALHLKTASRPHPPESLSLQSSGATAGVSVTSGASVSQTYNTNTVASAGPGIQTSIHHTTSTMAPPPRRVPSPALPQIPPNLHPDLPPPPVPLLCFPDSQDTMSDRDS